MYQKQQQNNYHASENISLMVANVTQIKSGAMINAGVSAKIQKISSVQKNYIWDPATCSCKNGKYWISVIDNSVDTSDDIIDTIKTVPTKMYKIYKMLKTTANLLKKVSVSSYKSRLKCSDSRATWHIWYKIH